MKYFILLLNKKIFVILSHYTCHFELSANWELRTREFLNEVIADAVPGTRRADPQCILILEDASTGVTPQCAAITLVKML